jgi:hypothetical protein
MARRLGIILTVFAFSLAGCSSDAEKGIMKHADKPVPAKPPEKADKAENK